MDTIKIITTAKEEESESREVPAKGLVGLPNFNSIQAQVIEFSGELIKEQIQSNLTSIINMVSEVNKTTTNALVKEIKVSLGITGTGEVGFFSVAKGSLSGNAAIEFIIHLDNPKQGGK